MMTGLNASPKPRGVNPRTVGLVLTAASAAGEASSASAGRVGKGRMEAARAKYALSRVADCKHALDLLGNWALLRKGIKSYLISLWNDSNRQN